MSPRVELPSRHPRLMLTRARALAIVTMSYVGVIGNADILFRYLAHVRGEDEAGVAKYTFLFGCIMGACWLVSVAFLLRDWRRHSREKAKHLRGH